ncbi:MAG: hypothetical protein KGH66_00145 [Candidatus Micrarchaeota archaeon]|nr:hypothetical protein [Candidatus Micrarchaeota archaeon]
MIVEKNITVYAGAAIVVAVIVVAAALLLSTPNYSISVKLLTNSTPPIYPYQTSNFAILVANKGSAVSNLVIGFYLNASELNYYKISIPADKTVLIPANYTYTTNGTYRFSAVADPAHVLSIKDRNGTTSTNTLIVTQAQGANIFTSIPNNNINYTQSFSFTTIGLESSSAAADRFNISVFNDLFAIPQAITAKIGENVFQGTAYANGAYARYLNGSAAYTLWLQGEATPQQVQYIASTFQIPSAQVELQNATAEFMKVSNTTSMCAFYSNGWTKIISYYNNSMGSSCRAVAASTYQPTESNTLVSALKANPKVPVYRSQFTYTNSTLVGSAIIYSNRTLGVANMFYNNFGFFTSVIQSNAKANWSANQTGVCRGLSYDNGTTNVCSVYVAPKAAVKANGYAMVNSTQIGASYILQLFSLVNQTNLVSAHVNAVSLIRALNISQNTTKWVSAFNNACNVNNSSIPCRVTSFDYVNNTAYLNFTNMLGAPLHVNHAACYVPGERLNFTVNDTLRTGQSLNLRLPCTTLPIPIVSPATSYLLQLNYTYNGTTRSANGFLNVTNPGLGGG